MSSAIDYSNTIRPSPFYSIVLLPSHSFTPPPFHPFTLSPCALSLLCPSTLSFTLSFFKCKSARVSTACFLQIPSAAHGCFPWLSVCPGADPGFDQGGAASGVESCRCSTVESCEWNELSAVGVQGSFKGSGSFWDFNAQICIISHSRDSFSLIFDIYFNTKSWTLDCTSINLRYSYILHLFFNLHEKLCFDWMTWGGMPSEARLK